jgi:hypothetical protein
MRHRLLQVLQRLAAEAEFGRHVAHQARRQTDQQAAVAVVHDGPS